MKIEEAPMQLNVERISSATLVPNNKSDTVHIMQHMVIQSSGSGCVCCAGSSPCSFLLI